MRQLTYVAPGDLRWLEVPEPALQGRGEAIVRPLAVATCDLDGAIVHGRAPLPAPFALGHEFVAEVVEIGEDVKDVRAGMRVIVPFQISCGRCGACARGHTAYCSTKRPRAASYGLGDLGGREWGGALSDLVRVPHADHMLVELPDWLEPTALASCSDNLADAWRAVGPQLAAWPDASVLVVGGGLPSIGLYSVAIARALGAETHYSDTDPQRLRFAEQLGAQPIEGPPQRRAGRHLVTVDASQSVEGLHCAIRSTFPGGSCTSVSVFWHNSVEVPLLEMYTNGISLHTGRVNSRAAVPHVLRLMSETSLRPEAVTTAVVGWDDAVDALLEPFTKLVLVPEA